MKKVLTLALSTIAINCHADGLKILKTEVNHISYQEYNSIEHVKTKTATCTASANSASGFAGNNIQVSGYVSYIITNNTTTSQNYWVDEYMCVNGFGCTHIRNTVSLGAHASGNGGGNIYNSEVLPKGTFVDQASIQVTGESTCYVQGSNTVFVN